MRIFTLIKYNIHPLAHLHFMTVKKRKKKACIQQVHAMRVRDIKYIYISRGHFKAIKMKHIQRYMYFGSEQRRKKNTHTKVCAFGAAGIGTTAAAAGAGAAAAAAAAGAGAAAAAAGAACGCCWSCLRLLLELELLAA